MTDQIKIEKRLIEKSPGSFIFEFDNEIPPEKCDEIVQRFEESKDDHYRGRVGPNFEENDNVKFLAKNHPKNFRYIKCDLVNVKNLKKIL